MVDTKIQFMMICARIIRRDLTSPIFSKESLLDIIPIVETKSSYSWKNTIFKHEITSSSLVQWLVQGMLTFSQLNVIMECFYFIIYLPQYGVGVIAKVVVLFHMMRKHLCFQVIRYFNLFLKDMYNLLSVHAEIDVQIMYTKEQQNKMTVGSPNVPR